MTGRKAFSEARLARLNEAMHGFVGQGMISGAVTLLCRKGEVHARSTGTLSMSTTAPMQSDSLFRIASVTKGITAVAALILVEECKLRLDEPVDEWLPELANRQVLRTLEGPADDTVPAERPLTLRDLLTFRMGFGAVMAMPGTYPIQQVIEEAGLAAGPHQICFSADEYMARLGGLPLLHQPGEQWMYHSSADVLGILISRVAGSSLGAFFQERIFSPLGMEDTFFQVPEEKIRRLTTMYQVDDCGTLSVWDEARGGHWSKPLPFEAGGSGLVSTAEDLLKFSQMLLNGGRADSGRLLARPTIELMTTDQLTPAQKAASAFFPGFWDYNGWGMGISVTTAREGLAWSPGSYGWDGGYGTSWRIDPREEMIGILLTQRLVLSPVPEKIYTDFWTLAYQAIED